MNQLSLFLYAADVISKVSGLLVLSIIVLCCVFCGALAFYATERDELYPRWKMHATAIVALSLVTALIPSKDTMYAIAASQMGEQAVKSQIGQKTLGALEAWLDKQIEKK